MRPFLAISLALMFAATPALVQETGENGTDDGEFNEGLDLLSEGTRLLLRGLMKEFEPALRELEGVIDDLNAYHPPEVLPNGDIIIRRKVPLQVEPDIGEDGEVEL